MSDYLWDKSGESDPTIERLENLLAKRGLDPEPLRLPPAVLRPAPRARNPRRAYPRFAAIAAGIVLALLTGVWVLTTNKREGAEQVPVATNDAGSRVTGEESARPPAQVVNAPPAEEATGTEGRGASRRTRPVAGAAGREARTIKRAAREPLAVARAGRTSTGASPDGGRLTAVAEGAGGTQADSPALAEQRLAKEQLMLAMRVASAKLNIARNLTQAPHAAEGGVR